MAESYPCPCCGHLSFSEPPGSYEICEICFWQDDAVQLRWPDWSGGANKPSLLDAQREYIELGACESRLVQYTRAARADDSRDSGWRPIDLEVDAFEPLGLQRRPWPEDRTTLYWWRPSFWLPNQTGDGTAPPDSQAR